MLFLQKTSQMCDQSLFHKTVVHKQCPNDHIMLKKTFILDFDVKKILYNSNYNPIGIIHIVWAKAHIV